MNHLLGLQHRRQYLVLAEDATSCCLHYHITRYCLTDSFYSLYLPRASPSVTNASLSIALQAIPPHVTGYGCFGLYSQAGL